MKSCGTSLLLLACLWPRVDHAQWLSLPDPVPQRVFGSDARKISTQWHNPGNEPLAAEMRLRLYQASSATAAPLMEKPWKQIELLPGQTVLESASVDFPAVNAETTLIVQWLTATNRIVGRTEVLVYPTNLLAELKSLFNVSEALGVLDPNGSLTPSLKQNGVPCVDLGEKSLDDFSGKLAIIGPFPSKSQMRDGLAQSIRQIAKKGVAVVWIQPPPGPSDDLQPSFYLVPEGRGAVVIVQSDLVADFSDNPRSQLNLIHLCKLALNPAPLPLPNLPPNHE